MLKYRNSTETADAYYVKFCRDNFCLFRDSAKKGKLSEVKIYLDYGAKNQLLLDMLIALDFCALRQSHENDHHEIFDLLAARLLARYPHLYDVFIMNTTEPKLPIVAEPAAPTIG